MRALALFGALTACGGGGADVTGSAGGITFGESRWVYFGGPFIVISQVEAECDEFAWVRRNYEVGQAPTETNTALLEFAFADEIVEGLASVAADASVAGTVVRIQDGVFEYTRASSGVLTIDSVVEETSVAGVFEALAFEDGTLDGSFDAVYCRNLKE